ncbi:hypothetical protein VTK73DRAFT_9635 [Phialemonium thermophilum]|uniref:Uncharacterized protein n=1 Tax=Phialemonium thermophilum TaxID=223376 RepID=A0ABR3W1A9_9PEZI
MSDPRKPPGFVASMPPCGSSANTNVAMTPLPCGRDSRAFSGESRISQQRRGTFLVWPIEVCSCRASRPPLRVKPGLSGHVSGWPLPMLQPSSGFGLLPLTLLLEVIFAIGNAHSATT